MILIGIIGKKQSGKSTIAKLIEEINHPRITATIGFADALKEEIARATGFDVSHIEKHKASFRTLLQVWGTDFRRNLTCDDYWIRQVLKKINTLDSKVIYVVCPDVRFLNEAKMIKDVGGYLVRVVRPPRTGFQDVDKHSSETEQEDIVSDFQIHNDGPLEDLYEDVKCTLDEIKKNFSTRFLNKK